MPEGHSEEAESEIIFLGEDISGAGRQGGIAIGESQSQVMPGGWGLRCSLLLEMDKNISKGYIEASPCGPRTDDKSESTEVREKGWGPVHVLEIRPY